MPASTATATPLEAIELGPRPTRVRYWVLAAFCTAAAIGYVQRYAINFLAEPMQRDLELDKTQMGWVMAGFFWTYALMSIPSGWIADRWGTRYALTLNALFWSLAVAGVSTAGNLKELFVTWSLAGAAQAGLFPCAVIGVKKWLPPTRRAFASGMLSSFMSVGAVLAPLVAGALLNWGHLGWRSIYAWLAAPGIVWALAFFAWYRDVPAAHASVNAAERELIETGNDSSALSGPRTPWLQLATSPRMAMICGQHFFRAAGQVFFGTWFGTFLRESTGIASKDVAWLASLPPFVLIVGASLGGVISDWLLRVTGSRRVSRQALAVVNMLLCAAMFALAAASDDARLRVALICAGCLWMAIGGVSSYTITMDMGGRHVATVFSTMNMCGSLGAAAFPLYAGWLVDRTKNWDYVLLSITGIYLAAAVCWSLLNPNGSLFDEPLAEEVEA